MGEDTDEALRTHGNATSDGRYWFSNPRMTHSEVDALRIASSCLTLGVPVTDVMTVEKWFTLINRVADLERRLDDRE